MNKNATSLPNFQRINYALRPAKHAERKMFCETFSRLSLLDNLKNYRYIGMGSAYFSDFNLFHKTLGITKLISIEGEDAEEYKDRINFNIPFACIAVEFRYSNVVLPTLPWQKWKSKSIVWLDYVDKLMSYMLGDIHTVIFNARPGSVFLISVNIENEEPKEQTGKNRLTAKQYRIRRLEENVGKRNIPHRAYTMNLNVENNKQIIREIIHNTILHSVKTRNDGIDEKNKILYKQLFNIHYKDSADMLTVGGIIYNTKQKSKVSKMFENLDFIRTDESCFSIVVPKLTYREIQALEKVLPNDETIQTGIAITGDKKIPLSVDDVKNYAKIYRYFLIFPRFCGHSV